ncbi:hypothetical protein DFH08DRAFT_892546 [Mycena albidolilacea]|uniref:Uncharacterized protein n=1 Tax=Mycena albidolilacea TaxID=1033008 RepID=A0AAD7EEQ2_9AGAR|nr:hypothetical protein DFH08DRAFT_892546 [Mycena albidolilacea]
MRLLQSIPSAIVSYRLGYSPKRPYPWRWTTPVVSCAFLLLAIVLAAINVPLSAYEIDQQFTYRPNDTLPPLPLSNLIPQIFQHQTGGFNPQLLSVGDRIQLNSSMFNFTIMQAFAQLNNTQPVSSFSYYNNLFSEGCDVSGLRAELALDPNGRKNSSSMVRADMKVTVTCLMPALFRLDWSEPLASTSLLLTVGLTPPRVDSWDHGVELVDFFAEWLISGVSNVTGISVYVEPCCNCGETTSTDAATSLEESPESWLPTQLPCSSLATRFMPIANGVWVSDREGNTGVFNGTTQDFFASVHLDDDDTTSTFNSFFQNSFQSLYHLIRLELGVILQNQIYASPEMYNLSILAVGSVAKRSRASTANATLMEEWMTSVSTFKDSDRTPVMPYLRPVPQLKALGSALTSVFVSTFAMLSVLWTIFSAIAGAYVSSHSDNDKPQKEKSGPHTERDLEKQTALLDEWDSTETSIFSHEEEHKGSQHTMLEHMKLAMEKNGIAMAEMQLSLSEMKVSWVRMRLLLRNHGILEEEDGA